MIDFYVIIKCGTSDKCNSYDGTCDSFTVGGKWHGTNDTLMRGTVSELAASHPYHRCHPCLPFVAMSPVCVRLLWAGVGHTQWHRAAASVWEAAARLLCVCDGVTRVLGARDEPPSPVCWFRLPGWTSADCCSSATTAHVTETETTLVTSHSPESSDSQSGLRPTTMRLSKH